MEKGFATLPVNATQAAVTVAVRIWFVSLSLYYPSVIPPLSSYLPHQNVR